MTNALVFFVCILPVFSSNESNSKKNKPCKTHDEVVSIYVSNNSNFFPVEKIKKEKELKERNHKKRFNFLIRKKKNRKYHVIKKLKIKPILKSFKNNKSYRESYSTIFVRIYIFLDHKH